MVVRRRENLQIRFRNEAHEKQLQAARRQRVQDDIRRHIGLRWLFEALVANGDLGDLEKIVTAPPCNPETLAPVFIEDLTTLKQRFDRVRDRFKRRPPPFLVGHNLFGDLVYLLRCFVGPLPPTVEEFCTLVRTFFPITVDTKYLATHGCGDLPPSSSLEKIEEQLQERHVPMISECL